MIVRNFTDAEQSNSRVYPIAPGTMYILDRNDEHVLRAHTELKIACLFNPRLSGKGAHNAEGAYELEAEEVAA